MSRHRNVKNPRTVSVIVDGDVYDKFIDQLPSKTGTSEAIRNLISAQVEETEKIKNACSLDQSAIKQINIERSNDFNLSESNKQPTIDFFCLERTQIPKLAYNQNKKDVLGFMTGHCKEFVKYANKRMDQL